MAKKSNARCVSCGREMWSNYVGRVKPCCHPCRRSLTRDQKLQMGVVRPNSAGVAGYEHRCTNCSLPFQSKSKKAKFCSRECCSASQVGTGRRRAVSPGDRRVKRGDRERVAPGLRWSERKRLMQKWKRQRRSCAFCDRPADTIDHAVPLSRGGTNYEGNLIPCCKSCNSSKSDLLTVEWRYGCAHGRTVSVQAVWLDEDLMTRRRLERTPKPKPEPTIAERACYVCGAAYSSSRVNRRTCGTDACSYEHAKRSARESYRVKAGLPATWDVPTKPQVRDLKAS